MIDEKLRSQFQRVEADAAKRGLRVIAASNPAGHGWRFEYAPTKPKRERREEPEPRRVARGAKPAVAQGSLL